MGVEILGWSNNDLQGVGASLSILGTLCSMHNVRIRRVFATQAIGKQHKL